MATTNKGIYYPADYTKVADVPADMKALAESVDTAIENSKYDDTAIKQDISNIEQDISEINQEQNTQNTNISANTTKNAEQDSLIQKLKDNMINLTTEEDTSLYITDAGTPPAKLTIRGNHYQETQEGTDNLAVLTEGTIEENGLTVNIQNGEATMSGTNTASSTTSIKIGTAYLYAGQTYYQIKTGSQSSFGARIQDSNGVQHWFSNTESSFICETTEEWDVYASAGASQTVNATFKVMLSKTSGAEWVQGKKTIPSLEYPSEIETVKNEVNVVVSNKNLYKITISDNNYNGIKLTVNKEKGYLSATGTSTGYSHSIGTVILKSGDYVFSGGPQNGDWNKQRLSIYVKNSEGTFENVTTIYKDTTYSVHLDKETEYRLNYVIPSGTTVTDEKIYPQVEKGTVATDFIKHEEVKKTLDIQQEMLLSDDFDLENKKEVQTWGYINTKNVTNLTVSLNYTNGDFRRYSVDLKINNRKSGEYLKIICTHFKRTDSRWHEYEGIIGWESGQTFCIGTFNPELDTAEKMKNFLLNNDVEIYYELATPTQLDLTATQKEVLAQLNNLDLYRGINNIYSEEGIALMQLDYSADTKQTVDSLNDRITALEQQLLNTAGSEG